MLLQEGGRGVGGHFPPPLSNEWDETGRLGMANAFVFIFSDTVVTTVICIDLMLVTAGALLFFSIAAYPVSGRHVNYFQVNICGRGRGRKARMCLLVHILSLSLSLSEPIRSFLAVLWLSHGSVLSWLESLDIFVLVRCFDPIHLIMSL